MKAKKGITLIELLIALVIVAIGLVAVISFLYASWKDWYINKDIKELQEDMDIASLNIKAVAEEANYYEIQDIIEGSVPEEGRRFYVKYT
ncbi:MAG: prepilin-type N-terminal cleavage/methylation domain-containing protein, partial [Candidatus Omnitrophica bacterium]|nr:prepilin-type N-terminal cleavage/methylation domain-containing protein [Candidatus Omnitrophota bacterium]